MDEAREHLQVREKDNTADMGDFASRIPNVPTDHKLAWLPDGRNQVNDLSDERFRAKHG